MSHFIHIPYLSIKGNSLLPFTVVTFSYWTQVEIRVDVLTVSNLRIKIVWEPLGGKKTGRLFLAFGQTLKNIN